MLSARAVEDLLHAHRFSHRHLPAFGREVVVTAPLVIAFQRGAPPDFHDQAIGKESLDDAVERPRAELDLSAGLPGDLLQNRVAVLVAGPVLPPSLEPGFSNPRAQW